MEPAFMDKLTTAIQAARCRTEEFARRARTAIDEAEMADVKQYVREAGLELHGVLEALESLRALAHGRYPVSTTE